MNLWKSLEGMVEVELTGADLPGSLRSVNEMGIPVQNVSFSDELTARLWISRRHLPVIRKLSEKRGEKLIVKKRRGLYWSFAAAARRPVLLLGLALLLFLSAYLPTRVLFIRVEGNESVPSRRILAAAEDCGIRFGASRREVRSEKVKNALLGAVPSLSWAGVNTEGCVAVISVRERAEPKQEDSGREVSSLVAARDGIIVSCTVTDGSARCTVGQAVKAGQTLISGYTDCGIFLQATRAEGEVIAQTRHQITAITPAEGLKRTAICGESRNYSLILGKKRINFWNTSGICGSTCGRMYEEYYITLPGGFVLPLALAVETHTCYALEEFQREPEDACRALADFSRRYVCARMISGTIVDEVITTQTASGSCRLEADYLCLEMIARRRQERKVELNGKSS